jgi:predicted nucleic-acid-binding protein
MRAVDTNLVVRLLRRDDPKQAAIAEKLFATGEIWIAKTVLLETDWVLRSAYGIAANEVTAALSKLVRLPNVVVEDRPGIVMALHLAEKGMDFADALHVSSRPEGIPFVTFDRKLVRCAVRSGVANIAGLD